MVHFDAYESTTCPILLRNCQLSGLTPVRLRLYQIVSTHLNQFQIGFLINFCECKFLDAVYELQGKKVCGRKGVKVELARDSQRKRKRFVIIPYWPKSYHVMKFSSILFRSRSISPETYRKYGSRTPSPRRKSRRSRSRSPIVRKSKPLKPNKPKVKNQKSEESESSSSSSSDEMTPPSSPKVEKKLVAWKLDSNLTLNWL